MNRLKHAKSSSVPENKNTQSLSLPAPAASCRSLSTPAASCHFPTPCHAGQNPHVRSSTQFLCGQKRHENFSFTEFLTKNALYARADTAFVAKSTTPRNSSTTSEVKNSAAPVHSLLLLINLIGLANSTSAPSHRRVNFLDHFAQVRYYPHSMLDSIAVGAWTGPVIESWIGSGSTAAYCAIARSQLVCWPFCF